MTASFPMNRCAIAMPRWGGPAMHWRRPNRPARPLGVLQEG